MKSIQWSKRAWEDYTHWQAGDPQIAQKINTIIRDCLRAPFDGIGKPEPLKGELGGWWSRRITAEHRFVYKVQGQPGAQILATISCRFHYQDIGKSSST